MALDLASATATLAIVANVATSFILTMKCCCNSRRRPLFAVATRNCNLFHAKGKVAKSASISWLDMMSSGMGDGSFSPRSSGIGETPAMGVFHGTQMSLTGWPSTDSVADICSSCPMMGIRSPWSVNIYRRLRGRVTEPVIWNRFRR